MYRLPLSCPQLSIVAVKMIQHNCEQYWAPAVCNIICREKIWHTIAWWYMIVWGIGFWLHTITYWHVGLQHPIHSMSSQGEIVRGDSAKLEERARLVQNLLLVVKYWRLSKICKSVRYFVLTKAACSRVCCLIYLDPRFQYVFHLYRFPNVEVWADEGSFQKCRRLLQSVGCEWGWSAPARRIPAVHEEGLQRRTARISGWLQWRTLSKYKKSAWIFLNFLRNPNYYNI